MASRHLSLRIDEGSYEKLRQQARRGRETVSELARRLIEEGLRMEAHPGIVFRSGPTGRRAALADGPDVWEIIDWFPEWENAWDMHSAETVGGSSVTAHQVFLALRYYKEYRDEIDERIRLNREAADRGYAEWLETQQVLSR